MNKPAELQGHCSKRLRNHDARLHINHIYSMKKHYQLVAICSAAALAALSSVPALAAAEKGAKASKPAAGDATGAAAKLAGPDASFVKNAAADGMAEVKLGELARDKAENADVKEFGSMMVTDHGKANEELTGIASAKGVELPADLDPKHKNVHAKLSKLSGAEFDKEYLSEMLKGHKKAVSDFEKASKSAKDPEVKAFAEKTLPTLKHHLEKVQALSGAQSGAKEKPKKGA
jgi:putative membrane protein